MNLPTGSSCVVRNLASIPPPPFSKGEIKTCEGHNKKPGQQQPTGFVISVEDSLYTFTFSSSGTGRVLLSLKVDRITSDCRLSTTGTSFTLSSINCW